MRPRLVPVIEIAVSFAAAALVAWLSTFIKVNPLDRVGQVSGLAAIQIRYLACAIPVLVAVAVSTRYRDGRWFPITSRMACAALAGLASGFVAGGILVALRGTPFCLNAGAGDSDILVMWANAYHRGDATQYPPAFYPPLFPQLLRYYAEATDQPAVYALKDLQILFTATAGPVAYCAWRLILRPGWALGVGVVAAMVIIDPYKPYGAFVLVVFVPIVIRYFARLREAGAKHPYELVRTGVIYGLVLGVLCLMYSGWFRWAGAGLVIAGCVVFPWRRWKHGAVLVAVTLVVILIVDWSYITGLLGFAQKLQQAEQASGIPHPLIADEYIYFDSVAEPTFFTLWKGDLPGTTVEADWPPLGELGGLGLFTIALFAGTGTALALGRRRTDIITMVSVLGAIWVQRFWTARAMFKTKLVQLWPRTTLALIYLFVLLTGFAAYFIYERKLARAGEDSPLRAPSSVAGALVALTLLFGSMGSSISNRYMPYSSLPRTTGWLAFLAHDAWQKVKAAPETAPKL
ncbi:MAG TPA: hypothetical protein VMZ53_17475 [Kofleriaceae bacterium]|nr:hypothetical protein [Kofleriaceae bacterium]